jgi:hypothetical protein
MKIYEKHVTETPFGYVVIDYTASGNLALRTFIANDGKYEKCFLV